MFVDTFSLKRSPQRPIFATKRISLFSFFFFFFLNDLSRIISGENESIFISGRSTRQFGAGLCFFSPSFNRSAYCTRTMAAVEHGFVSILRSGHASNPPSVVRRYKHALFSGGSVLTHIAAEKGNWFRTYRWHFRSTTFIAWRPPRVFPSPSECAATFFAIPIRHSRSRFKRCSDCSFHPQSFVRRGNNEFSIGPFKSLCDFINVINPLKGPTYRQPRISLIDFLRFCLFPRFYSHRFARNCCLFES